MATVVPTAAEVLLPTLETPFALTLPPALQALRDRALEVQRGPYHGVPEITLADAEAWAAHAADEDWLVWRGRRTAARLRMMPLELEPGELLVGKPLIHAATPEQAPALEAAQATLGTMPPYPGGDSGHFHPDWQKVLTVGASGLLAEISERAAAADLTDEQRHFYTACRLVMEGFVAFLERLAVACEGMAESDAADAARWQELAAINRRLQTSPPATLHEAMQLMFAMQIALWFGEDHYLASPGRVDQTLRSFYEGDRAAGRITPRQAFELLCCLYIHQNRILWPGSAVAVMVGGRDTQGRDVTNELTYLALAARQATKLVYPTVGLAWHEGTPDELMDYAVKMLATGGGDPALFNDEVIPLGLRDHGVSVEDSYNYMNSTCVEIKVCGASHMWVTAPYFNLPQGLLNVLGQISAGEVEAPTDLAGLTKLVEADLAATISQAAANLDRCWWERGRTGCFPLASCVISDCLERGVDFDRGGARYNWVENSFVGLANLADGLEAIQRLVFERQELTLAQLHDILQRNYEGHEDLRQKIVNTLPHYGNDDDEVDGLAKQWAEFLIATTEGLTVGLHRYVPGFFCWIIHEDMGRRTGATPDGRLAGWPLADGAGGCQGQERRGPTAAVLSSTKWSHQPVLGGLVHNIKFTRNMLANKEGRAAARGVLETYLRRGGFEIQVNVVSRDTLRDAQEHPERYQDLLVRVAGYSDYFVHLNRNMQEEVIARTEHGAD